jgi:hypothetical protein
MKNAKTKITVKKHKYKINNKSNACVVSNNDNSFSNDNNNNNYNNVINEYEYECLICLEVKNTNNEKTFRLNDLEICEKQCECNGWFHKSCLDTWFIIKFACPICRNEIHSFTPYQINQVNHFNHTQTHIQIIQRRLTRNEFFIIFFSIIFVYWFYF